ncbi:ubiquitin fusion degradation protein ufd1ap [Cystoisospora suis]|uniref:Ubiquitin fusion degradation protein ufd1ap n=1 Tax=Cystoisospora suis TaxID=483139 RepID=A0A2C6LG43_9APIC|nr:ubiquitin fusion degradation protein ufd1ap [Cystoisospora suis]
MKDKKRSLSSCLLPLKKKREHPSEGRRFSSTLRVLPTTILTASVSTHSLHSLVPLSFLFLFFLSSPSSSPLQNIILALTPTSGLYPVTYLYPSGLPVIVQALSVSSSSSFSSQSSTFPSLQSSHDFSSRGTSSFSSHLLRHYRPSPVVFEPRPSSSSAHHPTLYLSFREEKRFLNGKDSFSQIPSAKHLLPLATISPFDRKIRKKPSNRHRSSSPFPVSPCRNRFSLIGETEEKTKEEEKKISLGENERRIRPSLSLTAGFSSFQEEEDQCTSLFSSQKKDEGKRDSVLAKRRLHEEKDDTRGILLAERLQSNHWRGGGGRGQPRRREEEVESASGGVSHRHRGSHGKKHRKSAGSSSSVSSFFKDVLLRSQVEQQIEDLNILLREQGNTDRLYLVLPLTFHLNPSAEHFSHDHIMEGDKASFPKEVLHLLLEKRWEAPWQFLIEKVHSPPFDGDLEDSFFCEEDEENDDNGDNDMKETGERDEEVKGRKRKGVKCIDTGASSGRFVMKKEDTDTDKEDREEEDMKLLSKERLVKGDASEKGRERREKVKPPRRISLSVLDFSAPRNFLFLPPWMMKDLKLKPLSVVACKWARLPLAAHVSLQPLSKSFTEYLGDTHQNVQKILEDELRHYSSLSTGTEIPIRVDNKIFHLRVVDVSAENGENDGDTKQETDHVSVQDSDVATSLIPAVEEDAQEQPSSFDNKPR